MVGAGNPLTVATAERYKIRANSFRGLQVTDRLREREREREVSVDYTVTSSQIGNLERKPGWTDEGMDSSLLTDGGRTEVRKS